MYLLEVCKDTECLREGDGGEYVGCTAVCEKLYNLEPCDLSPLKCTGAKLDWSFYLFVYIS